MRTQRTRLNQAGIASFILVMVLMLIISLVALGFAKVIRREQRQVLDQNLNTQAFYAAESGVNLAQKVLNANPSLPAKTACGADTNFTFGGGAPSLTIDSTTNTNVSCLTTTTDLPALDYQTLTKYRSLVVPLNGVNSSGTATSLSSLDLSWDNTTPQSSYCAGSIGFPAAASWTCNAPILRVDLVDVTGNYSRAALPGRTFTFFAYPLSGGSGSIAFAGGSQGQIANGTCTTTNTPFHCKMAITGLGASSYYMRVVSMYTNASLDVRANGGSVLLRGAQVVIDSTGKSQDIVRRVQVHVPLGGNEYAPDFGVESAMGICKRYLVGSGTVTLSASDGGSAGVTDPTNVCGIP